MHTFLLILAALCLANAAPVLLNTTNFNTVLMIGAHPDDIEACSGGLANQLNAQGAEVF